MKEFHRTHGKQGARQITLDNPKNKLSAQCAVHTWVLQAKFNAKLSVIQPSSGHLVKACAKLLEIYSFLL